jgi:DNA-binding FadR family transcriptional regulator
MEVVKARTYDVSMDAATTGARVRPTAGAQRSERPARFASIVVEELAHRIIAGTLAEHDVLPTESELGQEFGFSRTVIREALKMLEERGLVRVEQGRGTTVQPRDAWNLLDPLVIRVALTYDDDMSLLDSAITVRRVLERDMARAAAARITEEELGKLGATIDEMAAAYDDYERFRLADLGFHEIIMKASGNDVGLTVVRTIHKHAGERPAVASMAPRAALERTVTEHRSIYAALEARDGDTAGERISAHIDFAWADRRRKEPA